MEHLQEDESEEGPKQGSIPQKEGEQDGECSIHDLDFGSFSVKITPF